MNRADHTPLLPGCTFFNNLGIYGDRSSGTPALTRRIRQSGRPIAAKVVEWGLGALSSTAFASVVAGW
jgi:hypothetical protein